MVPLTQSLLVFSVHNCFKTLILSSLRNGERLFLHAENSSFFSNDTFCVPCLYPLYFFVFVGKKKLLPYIFYNEYHMDSSLCLPGELVGKSHRRCHRDSSSCKSFLSFAFTCTMYPWILWQWQGLPSHLKTNTLSLTIVKPEAVLKVPLVHKSWQAKLWHVQSLYIYLWLDIDTHPVAPVPINKRMSWRCQFQSTRSLFSDNWLERGMRWNYAFPFNHFCLTHTTGDGLHDSGCGHQYTWSHHQCHRCQEGIRRHGGVQLRRKQYLWRHCGVSKNWRLRKQHDLVCWKWRK